VPAHSGICDTETREDESIQPQTEGQPPYLPASVGIYQTVLLDWYPDFGGDPDNYIRFFSCTKGSAAQRV